MCGFRIFIAVIITLLLVAIALLAAIVAAIKRLVGAVRALFTRVAPVNKSGFAAAPGGGDGDGDAPPPPSGYSGDLCINYCDPHRAGCSKACLNFNADGPVFV